MTDMEVVKKSAAPGVSPFQAFDLQMKLAREYADEGSILRSDLQEYVASGDITLPIAPVFGGDPERYFAQHQSRHLLSARTYWISETMLDLVLVAAEDAMVQPFYETDTPSLEGFLVFERPLVVKDGLGEWVSLGGFDWVSRPQGMIWTRYSSWDAPEDRRLSDLAVKGRRLFGSLWQANCMPYFGTGVVHYGRALPNLEDLAEQFEMPSDRDADPESYTRGQAQMSHALWSVIYTLFTLMNQPRPIADTVSFVGNRGERKAIQRTADKQKVEPEIYTVSLRKPRRPSGEPLDDEEEHRLVEHDYRWHVRGHWRWQWYPSYTGPCGHCTLGIDGRACGSTEGEHRRIWISDQIRGPEDKPIKPRSNVVHKLVR